MNATPALLILASLAAAASQESAPDDPKLPILERIRRASVAASSLDAEARKQPRLDARVVAWERAAKLIEDFNAKEPRHPQVRALKAQAESYRWGIANTWIAASRLADDPRPLEEKARAVLDGIIGRLRKLDDDAGRSDAVASALKLRLAMSLADRAALSGGKSARADWEAAREVLDRIPPEPSAAGAIALTRARALNGLGRYAEGLESCDRAAASKPSPAESELLPIRTDAWIGLKKFDEGIAALGRSRAEPERHWQLIRLQLAEWPTARDRAKLGRDLVAAASALRKAKAPQEHSALRAIDRGIESPPDGAGTPLLALLADSRKAAGKAEEAGELYLRAAEASDAPDAAALRLKGAAAWAAGPRSADADRILGELASADGGGPIAIQANSLRAWLRGQAWARDPSPSRKESYLSALREQIGRFPGDPSANDARWDLGRAFAAEGKTAEAIAPWSEIPREHPRWLDARLAASDRLLADLDLALRSEDSGEAERIAGSLRDWLDKAHNGAKADAERIDIDLKRAELEVVSPVGSPSHALVLCERAIRGLLTPERRERARLWQAVALCSLNRGKEARDLVEKLNPATIPDDLRRALGTLDRFAAGVTTEAQQEQAGELMVGLVARFRATTPAAAEAPEIRLREIRGLLHAHRGAEASTAFRDRAIPAAGLSNPLLADLADAQLSAGELSAAESTQELRIKRAARGSRPWLEARFGLAEVLHRLRRDREARQLLETTAILHPDLGGGQLRLRFESLRRALGR